MKNLFKLITTFFVILFLTASCSMAETANQTEYSDTWLQSKLVTTYILNRHLSIFDIDTDVKDQVVTLVGEVDSSIDKDLAGEIAKSIKGVKGVQNNLTVATKKGTRTVVNKNDDVERSFGQQIDDMTTTAVVKTKLLAEDNVSGLNINVDTLNGRVTLNGEVTSSIEKDLAEKLAENTDNVRAVKNLLKIVSK